MADNKNPTAVKIGQRIKQARKMAGFNTAAQLLEQLDDWGTGRLGNYEAGISLPSPDDIQVIADTTGASACWIMFGHGPIRAVGRDIQAIRHQNFVHIINNSAKQRGGINRFLKTTGITQDKLENHINNPFLKIPNTLARKCEKFAGKKTSWIDQQHVETDPVCASFPTDMQRLMMFYSELPETGQKKLIKLAEILFEE